MKKIMKRIAYLMVVISLITVVASAGQNPNTIKIPQPIIKLRTLKDSIDNKTDGTIEIYVENPWTSGLNVDISATGTDNVYFFSEIFQAGAKGAAGGNFIVPPGQKRTVYISVRADKIGKYPVQINGEYYTEASSEENIASQKIYFTQIFKVNEKNPNVPEARYTASILFSGLYKVVQTILTTVSNVI